MKKLALFLVLLTALAALGPASTLVAQDAKFYHAVQQTLLPGTTYYFPDGRASADSAWLRLGSFTNSPSYWSLYVTLDSTLGYDSPCSLRVEAVYGLDGTISGDTMRLDTLAYYGYPTTSVVFNQPFFVIPEDSSQLISCGVYLHDEHRWKVTATDTCALSLTEKVGKP